MSRAMIAAVGDLLVRAGAEPAPLNVSIDPSAPLEYAALHPSAALEHAALHPSAPLEHAAVRPAARGVRA